MQIGRGFAIYSRKRANQKEYMIKKRTILLIALSAVLAASASGQTSDPVSAVRAFYAYDSKASPVFNRRNLDSRRRYLSPRLYNLFRQELRKESAFLKANPGEKPFFGDGFPFRPIDEPCQADGRLIDRRYSVAAMRRYRGPRVDVPVRFAYPRPCNLEALIYKARVIRSGSRWLIDDIVFEDGSTLSDTMKNNRY